MAAAALAVALILAPVPSDPQPQVPAQLQLFASRSDPAMSGTRLPYRGKYWRAEQADFTRCVLERESNGHWYSTNRANGYFGAFQFNKALAEGASWMMRDELRQMYGHKVGTLVSRQLRATEMHRWVPLFQQMAFATVLNWQGDYSGVQHWNGGRWTCG
jgi:hypothetical protein